METSISRYFDDLPDPRIDRCKLHTLTDIVTIAVCALISLDDLVLTALGRLSVPAAWQQQALEHARTMIATEHPGHIDHAALEAKLKRLARLYQDGLIDDTRYERDRDAIRAQLSTAMMPLPYADLDVVATLLGDIPGLLKEATNEERRAVLIQLVDQVYLTHDAVLGIRPTLRAWPLMHAVYAQFLHSVTWWAGWAPMLRDHDDLTRLMVPVANEAEPFLIAV